MKSYVIVTRNMNLIRCTVPPEEMLPVDEECRKKMKLDADVIILDHDQDFAFLAFMEGSKVYEARTNKKLVPEYETEEELVEKMVELLLKVLEIDQDEKGYAYLKYMLKLHVEDLDYNSETMGDVVYPDCAKHFGVSPRTVSKHANRVLKDSIAKNKYRHIALWDSMVVVEAVEKLNVAGFLVIAGEKIRTVIRNNLN